MGDRVIANVAGWILLSASVAKVTSYTYALGKVSRALPFLRSRGLLKLMSLVEMAVEGAVGLGLVVFLQAAAVTTAAAVGFAVFAVVAFASSRRRGPVVESCACFGRWLDIRPTLGLGGLNVLVSLLCITAGAFGGEHSARVSVFDFIVICEIGLLGALVYWVAAFSLSARVRIDVRLSYLGGESR